jgi:hypothetical protein
VNRERGGVGGITAIAATEPEFYATPLRAICGQPLNPDIKWPDPWCITADHNIPIADGGHNNGALQAVHRICNQRRWQQTVRHGRAW